jgi:hypothetical protein
MNNMMKKIVTLLFVIIGILSKLNAQVEFYEDFESGTLNPHISYEVVGSFSSIPGIKDNASFGSTKVFGFGKSTCGSSCFDNYKTSFILTFPNPTYVDSIFWKEMEIDGNWGSQGQVFLDDVALSGVALGAMPVNSGVADASPRYRAIEINQVVTTIKLVVNDITNVSEIIIDDFKLKYRSKINGYEYWFNNDYAGKILTPITPAEQLNLSLNIPTNSLSTGVHVFNFRSYDNQGKFSSTLSQFFYKTPESPTTSREIVEYEYWFDNSYENKQNVSTSVQQQVNINELMDASSLVNGIHTFNIRFKDNSGLWSSTLSQFFYKTPESSSINRELVEYEYWFDNEYAEKQTVVTTSLSAINVSELINTQSLSNGVHTFNIRFKDNSGLWSSTLSQFFYKTPESSNVNRELVEYEYWFDNDYETSIKILISPSALLNLNELLDASSLQSGIHTFNIRFKDNSGLWSSTISQFFYKISPVIYDDENKITVFKYWFDDRFDEVVETEISTPVKQFILSDYVDMKGIEKGEHTIHFQFRDSRKMWSVVTTDTIQKLALPIANFDYEIIFQDCDSTVVQFVNKSIDGDEYVWDFDNGHTSSEIHPVHTFYDLDLYEVSLLIKDTITEIEELFSLSIQTLGKTYHSFSEEVCDSYISPSGKIYTVSDIYQDTLHAFNMYGCDSILTIQLNVFYSDATQETLYSCNASEVGVNQQYFQNMFGCDSVHTITTELLPTDSITYNLTSCHLDEAGIEYLNFTNQYGCDSVHTIITTYVPFVVNLSVVQNGHTLTATATGVTYQWIDCDNNNAPITDATEQTFTPLQSGNYAVILSEDDCFDVSDCYIVQGVWINNLSKNDSFKLYPNPSDGRVTIESTSGQFTLTIFDMSGRLVYQNRILQQVSMVDLSELKNGVYTISMISNQTNQQQRLVISR